MATDVESAGVAARPRVLLVEDSLVQRMAIAALLEKHAYAVDLAGDGAEALRALESGRRMANLVITDVGMPRMNGINLCRAIKQNPMTKHVPVIMLTSFDDDRNHRTAIEAGAAEFVTKPVSEQELIYRVEATLAQAGNAESLVKATWHQELFEGLADAVVVTDSSDHYLDANPAALEMLGYHHEELLRLDSKAVSLQPPNWYDTMRLRLKESGAYKGRVQLRHKDGHTVLAEAHIGLTSVAGDFIYIFCLRQVD